ncbi:hypothetical protein [Empedobacter stercoris]|uniref:hypothetical protein n=1 Tax=Empedobacter stercoris TaxID=1628248 RepID=UPI001CE215C9|nr:hypothetical protein [Empedobacter stercoris]MCA4775899.1 hypothetical protein [Empedobacter stercoris]
MKNIESFNLKELGFEEQVSTDGGYSWLWQEAAATFLYNVAADWKENVAVAYLAGR